MNLTAMASAIADKYSPPATGRPSVITDTAAMQILLSELEQGTHPEPAAELAGIAYRTVQYWLKRGEDGEEPYNLFLRAYKTARATVEARVTRNVITASEDPKFWAAGMTYLERTHPDRWARRSEDSNTPKVVVQIGVRDSDVQVQIAQYASSPSSLSDSAPASLLTSMQSEPVSD